MTVPLLQRRGRQAAEAPRPRPCGDRALRRVQDPRRRRHPDLDPERPRMARLADKVLGDAALGADTISPPIAARQAIAPKPTRASPPCSAPRCRALMKKLEAAEIAFARVNDPALVRTRICAGSPSARRAGPSHIRRLRLRAGRDPPLRPDPRARRAYGKSARNFSPRHPEASNTRESWRLVRIRTSWVARSRWATEEFTPSACHRLFFASRFSAPSR